MDKKSSLSRRSFLKRGGLLTAGLAAPLFVPATALGRASRPSAGNRVNLAIIGCGMMGTIDLRNFLGISAVEVVAVCDPDENHRKSAREIVETHQREVLGRSQTSCEDYLKFEDVLDRSDVDAVLIATPDHWHAGIAIAAAKAGKDIYGEKPLARTIVEGRNIVRAVERYGRVFQMGSQTRSHAPVQRIINLLRKGVIGNIERVELNLPQYGGGPIAAIEPVPPTFDYDRWLGPAPWAPYQSGRCHISFRTVLDYSGGTITDHGTHRLDVSQWGTDHEYTGPVRIEGKATYPEDGIYDTPVVAKFEMEFSDGITYYCETEPDEDKWGVTFIGDEGWIRVPMMAPLPHQPVTASNPKLLEMNLTPMDMAVYPSKNHWENFIECVQTRQRPAQNIEVGHRSTTLCHLANIAMELDRPVRWDPDKEIFPGDPEANAKLDRPKRAPWSRFLTL